MVLFTSQRISYFQKTLLNIIQTIKQGVINIDKSFEDKIYMTTHLLIYHWDSQSLKNDFQPQFVIMKLQRIITFYMARSNKPQLSFEELVQFKWKRFAKYSHLYQSDNKFQHEDKLYEEFVYGHSIHIAAVTSYNFQSLKFAKSVMKYANPNLLILGGINDNFCRAWQSVLSMPQRYEHPLLKTERMQCKERLNKLMQVRLVKDRNFMWDNKQKQILSIDHLEKRIIPHEYLTVAQMASIQDHTKIAFGKPSDPLIFEDIIMKFSIEQLKGIVQRAIIKVIQRQGDSVDWRMSYTRQAIQNYVMSEQSSIYSRQLTYQAALLKRYAKLENNILLLCPGYFVQRIAQQVHHIDIAPENVFRSGLADQNSQSYALLQKVLQNGPQQVLQKFALICLLKQNWIENQFAKGANVFKLMCFGSLFQNMEIQQLHARYDEARRSVQGKWFDLIRQRVNNVHVLPGAYIRLTLKEQFKLLEDRATKHFPYTYEDKNYLSDYDNKVKLINLQKRMMQILEEEGDKHNIELFQKFMQGQRSREGIILYSKLLGRANVEAIDRIKFPVFHYGAFRGIYKEYLRDFLLKAQENSKIEQKVKKRMDKVEEIMNQHLKKLDDPNQLHNYVTGKKGKVLNMNIDPDGGPQFSKEDIDYLQGLYGEMNAEDQQQMKQQYGEDWNKYEDKK